MYNTADKHYIWDLETSRDRLMTRLIQEKICPWSTNNFVINLKNADVKNNLKFLCN